MATLFTIVRKTVEFFSTSRQITESTENGTMIVWMTRDVYFPLHWTSFNPNLNCQTVCNSSYRYVNSIRRFMKRHIVVILMMMMMVALSMFFMYQYNELRNEMMIIKETLHDELFIVSEALQEKVSMHDDRIGTGEMHMEEIKKQQCDIEKRQNHVEMMTKFSLFWNILQNTFMLAWYFSCATVSTGLSFLGGLISRTA